MITKILAKMKKYIENPADSFDFSIELEDDLCENYDSMRNENAEVTDFLNETLPDICASYNEDNEKEFVKAIAKQYELTMMMYNEHNGRSC